MKAAMNGVLNLSVLDGWWPEAYSREIGWAFAGESDDADRAELFRLLEEEVIPTFYDDRERWEQDDGGLDRAGHAGVLQPPHGQGVRRALLRSREQMTIERVGVVGLGTMGAGIAQVCVQAGFETVGREVNDELAERGRGDDRPLPEPRRREGAYDRGGEGRGARAAHARRPTSARWPDATS